ncbi:MULTISPECIES: hypothetical protein [unclassified Leptolyngbya]|uniref:hypothetical protein n=1 Tax=unclassified Leptolyngbya TaxID=2650499 RepID=UPI0016871221|nr:MULTISPECIES: hypothetical protein [unclassified Leptolyngbya]MBD1913138.1 hypothetical protein [Leptolyngbya sp. FACHB-8]MBD2157834.1 hypothetical protein [Leptolyngbya sp. FACHB-16]
MPDKVVSNQRVNGQRMRQGQELGWSVEGSQAQLVAQPISPPEVMPPQRSRQRSRRKRAERAQRKAEALRRQKAARMAPPKAPAPKHPVPRLKKSPPAKNPTRQGKRRTGWTLSMMFMTGLGVTGGLGILALIWLTSLPPMPECDRVSRLSPDPEQLYCAQEAARSGELRDLKAAVDLVKDWTPRHPLYAESQQWLGRWSRNLMEMARQRYTNSDLKGALEIASLVPKSSPFYDKAQATIKEWQAEWEEGQAIYETAQEALKNQLWSEASQQLLALGRLQSPYWREQRMAQLTQQIFAERSSWGSLQEARRLARRKNPDNLQAALTQLSEIIPQTHAWEEAQENRQEWGTALASMGWQQWQQGNTDEAIALAQAIPTDLPLEGELAALVRYSHAQKLASWDVNTDWQPSPAQLWRLQEAIAALQGIPRSSALYSVAQTTMADWQGQLKDVTQLQMASAIASLGQKQALELAINQAADVSMERPRRTQAQTLIAFWRSQIELLQDQPILVRAIDLANSKVIPDLRKAIAVAETIGPDRALHEEAQERIAEWVAQIETIEDQPILDRARQLAKENKLRDAIREARQIQEGRALYAEASAAADGWQAEIDRVLIAEDRKILDEANGLAAQGSLTRAIDTAAQIGRGRPLYGEARASINQWEAERDAVWDSWSAPEATSDYEEPAYEEPADEEPVYEEPAYEEPVYEEPAYEEEY